MRRVLVVAAVLASSLLGSACRDRQLSQLQAARDEICACKTAACGKAALDKIQRTAPKVNHRSQTVANEMLDCLAKLYDADQPNPDLDQPRTAGSGSATP